MAPTARQAKAWAKKHNNFMTPIILTVQKVKHTPNLFVELSQGTDFNDKLMWGISLIKWDTDLQKFSTGIHEYTDLKKLVIGNYDTARQYFVTLIECPTPLPKNKEENKEIEA